MVRRKSSLIPLLLLTAFAMSLFASCLINVTLTFDANGGRFPDGSVIKKITTDIRRVAIPQEPERDDGLVFIGWYLDREGREPAGELLSKPVTMDMTFYAKWGYVITFETNGGTAVEPVKAAPGEPVEQPKSEKSGYKLSGWFLDDGTFGQPFDFSEMPAEHITLYAKWELFNTGLSFALINGGEEYEVSIGQCLDDEIWLPAVYEDKPVTTIPSGGFNNEGSLSTVVISESIHSIAPDAFEISPNLFSISVHPDNMNFISVGGNLYRIDEESAALMRYCPGKLDTGFGVPDAIFAGEKELAVTEVAESAFNDSRHLLMIVIPRYVSTIAGPLVNGNVQKAVFITEAAERPEGWAEDWAGERPAIMGCEVSADLKRVLSFTKSAGSIINPPQAFGLSGILVGDYVLQGWYTLEGEKVEDLLQVPEGTVLYADWDHKRVAKVLELLWEQTEYIFAEMFGGVSPRFVEIKSEDSEEESEEVIGKALLLGEPGYPVLAFECLSRNFDEVFSWCLANNEYPANYRRISNTNVYVADDCSMYYLFTKNVRKAGSYYYSKDGTALLYLPPDAPFEIPERVNHIGDRAFMGRELNSLSLANVQSIGTMAFAEAKLSTLELGEGLLTIGRMAFMGNEGLMEVAIPASVSEIKAGAFFGCKNLAEINVAEGNEYYKSVDGHLYSADGLTLVQCAPAGIGTFSIPEEVERIADTALASCSFDTVEIGAGVLEIGRGVFLKTNLREITVSEDNSNYMSTGGHLYTKDGSALIKYAAAKEDELFVVPEGVAVIHSGAFSSGGEIALKNVVICGSVTAIEAAAFRDIDAAFSVVIPESVSFIGRDAFADKTLYCEAAQSQDGWDASVSEANNAVYGCTLSQDNSYVISVSWQGQGFSPLAPFRQGYRFEGWYINSDFSEQGYTDLSGCPAGTYYAKWVNAD